MIELLICALLQDDLTAEKAEELFLQAYVAYAKQEREESTKKYEKIYAKFAKEPIGAIAAYNIACNLALDDKKDKAVEWIKKALEAGYDNFGHLEGDSDLDPLFEDKGFTDALAEAKKKAPKEPQAPIQSGQAKAFAEKLAQAHTDDDGYVTTACFSRLGWFHSAKTVEALNVELKKKGLKLAQEEDGWRLIELGD